MKPEEISYWQWIRYNIYFVVEHFLGYASQQKVFKNQISDLGKTIQENIDLSKNKELEVPHLPLEAASQLKKYKKLLKGPIVFRNAAKEWTACKKWDLEFFDKNYGDKEVLLNDLVGTIDPENPQTFQTLSLSEYIKLMKSGSLKYLKFSSLVQKEKALQEDLDLTWLHKFDRPLSFGKMFYMFVGGKGTVTPLHNEFPSVVYTQISGRKKWIMYMPENRIFLDPRTERKTYFYTHANPLKPEDTNYPLLKYSKKFEFILEPGDVLYFPPFMWHYVENLSESIGVSYKYANFMAGFKSSRILTILFLMATKPNLFVKFFLSRFRKEDYVLSRSEEASN